MRSRRASPVAAAVSLGLAGVLSWITPAPGMARPSTPERARVAAALPDWSGVWARAEGNVFDPATVEPKNGFAGNPGVRQRPPYTAAWEARYVANIAKVKAKQLPDPLNRCLPRGMPGVMLLPDQYEFAVTPEQVSIFIENGAQVRRIYTDGRPQLSGDDLFPTYNGNSVGRWEGDTLVARTVGLRDDMILDRTGATLSGDAVISERIRLTDPDTLEDQITIEDRQALTRPWVVTRTFRRQKPDAQLFDYACGENNRNPVDPTGKARLTGPDGKLLD